MVSQHKANAGDVAPWKIAPQPRRAAANPIHSVS